MRIACLMMQKNERDLLGPWIAYHSMLFGAENLYVYDNGSTDSKTKDVLRSLEGVVNVDYSRNRRLDFDRKGDIVASRIQDLDRTQGYDFFFPLDCDEFVAADLGGGDVRVDRESILSTLAPWLGDPRVLMIGAAFDNNPLHPDYYRRSERQRKCFFAKGACLSLDIGYHVGRAVTTNDRVKTPIAYIHMHHRPYRSYRYFGMQKMEGRVSDISEQGLRDYLSEGAAGQHIAKTLLLSEAEFEARFKSRPELHLPAFSKALRSLGTEIRYSTDYPEVISRNGQQDGTTHIGVLDGVSVRGMWAKAIGWGLSSAGSPATVTGIRVGSCRINDFEVTYVDRADVARAKGPQALRAGFEVRFPLVGIPEKDMKSGSLGLLLTSGAPDAVPGFVNLAKEKVWPFGDIAALPAVPGSPHVDQLARPALLELMGRSTCYLEYGIGGTTLKAAEIGIPVVVGVESDARWLETVRFALGRSPGQSKVHLFHADIGPTKAWGHPVSDSHWRSYEAYALEPWRICQKEGYRPDLVLVDGRFRVACFLASLLFAEPGTRVFFDDYAERAHYHVVEVFAKPAKFLGGLAEFVVPSDVPRDRAWMDLVRAIADPR